MKRKFILYPAVALALMTSASLSSCVDTDEPDSITDLRKAVAQEIQANAGLLNAKANVESAYVAVVNANAKKAEAEAAEKEYQNIQTKAEAELAAQVAQINMEKNEAVKAQYIEDAKLKADKEIQDAKKSLETATEGYLAEVENMKTALLKAQLENQVAIAKLKDNTVGLDALTAKYKAWTDAQDAVVDAEIDVAKKQLEFLNNKDRATDSITKLGAIEDAQKALEQAKDNLEHTKTTLANSGSDGFAALWKEYQEKVDGVDAKTKQLNGELTKLQEDLKLLSKAETEAKTALDAKTKPINDGLDKALNDAKGAVTALENTIKKAADVAVECKNSYLSSKYVANEDLSYKTHDKDGNEVVGKFEYKNGKFVASTDVRANDAAAVAKNIKAAFDRYSADQLLQNMERYKAISDEINSALTDNLNTLGKDDKSGMRKDWVQYTKDYNTAVSKKDKTGLATAEANLSAKAIDIFGDYADESKTFTVGEKTMKGNFRYFVGVSLTDDITALIVKAGLAKSVQEIEWARFGAYGAWKQLDIAFGAEGENAFMRTLMSDAETASKAVQAIVDTYTNAKKAADEKVAAAQKAKDETKAENSDAVKAEKEAYDAAKKAREDKDEEIKKLNAELAPIADQQKYDEAMAKYYGDIVKALDSKEITKVEDYETYMEFALSTLETEVKKAEATVAKKERELSDFLSGADDDSKAKALQKAKEDYEAAVKAEEKAKAEYEKELSYYGK